MTAALMIIVSYLIGSISFAMIIAKVHRVDLRSIGSGNLGATNLSRAVGKKWAYICFVMDVIKGFLPVLAAKFLLIENSANAVELSLWLAVGVGAILGHVFPVYLKFKGGKGVATSFGVVLGIWPYYTIPGLIVFAIWAAAVLIWKYISLASIIASSVFPIILIVFTAVLDEWYFQNLWPLIVSAVLLGGLVIFLHRKNITRLAAGTENKVMQKNS